MLDLSLILIVMATLFNTPSNVNTQADYQLVNSGINMAPMVCKGTLSLDTGKSPESQRLRFHHKCKSSENVETKTLADADDQVEVDIMLDLAQKRAVMIDHSSKSYRLEQADKSMLDRLVQHMHFETNQNQAFLEQTRYWLHTSKSDFWLSRIQDPAQGNLFTDLNLFSVGFNSHLSLKYSSGLSKDAFDIPANYKQIQ